MFDVRAAREKASKRNMIRQTNWEFLETRCLLSTSPIIAVPELHISPAASSSSVQGYTPAEISAAYGFNSINLGSGVTANGAGQTIAIVDAFNDPDIAGDLSTFDKQFSLPTASLTVESQTGSTKSLPSTDAGWATEISLDVEWAHAIAPGAKILLVETKSDSLTDLLAGVNFARDAAGVSVVSMSWGSSEFFQETQYDSDFTTPAGHQGVTFVAASGDEGGFSGPSWPASSSNVLAVGGTTLNLTSTGAYSSETAWSDSTGGFSRYEAEPAYQEIAQFSGGKSSPDVAYDADPNTGFAVYDSLAFEGDSGWQVYGGTSAGTPQWGALVAIADQGRALNGLGTLDGASNTLPTLYSLYTSATYFNNFHDETVGASSFSTTALPGYDLVTGLGSPQANQVVSVLVGSTIKATTVAQAKPVNTRSSFRNQSRRAVVIEEAQAPAMQNPSAVRAAPQRNIVEVQTFVPTAAAANNSRGQFASPTNDSIAEIQQFGPRQSIFNNESPLTDRQAPVSTNAPIVSVFTLAHRSTLDASPAASFANDAIGLHDSAVEAGLLASRDNEPSSTWKQLACLVGAGVMVGTYAATRRQKRTIGMP